MLASWLAFGTLNHTFTVPCTVKATDRRTIACPRAGVLAELFARPGDRVQEGQLLAAIDASDDFLQRAELTAEIESLSALVDQAVGERQAGQVRVNEAKKRSLEAQLAIVDASIAQAYRECGTLSFRYQPICANSEQHLRTPQSGETLGYLDQRVQSLQRLTNTGKTNFVGTITGSSAGN